MIYHRYTFHVPSEKMIRVITDTDANNEADDQFAIVHALLSPRFDNRGIIAAHFGTVKSSHSMLDSYEELFRICTHMRINPDNLVYTGAQEPMADESTSIRSEGAQLIIREALSDDPRPLFAIFLGPLTDLACAYLEEPRIADRLTAIWIGGGPYPDGGKEFNLSNDIAAANVVMKSPIPLWQIPQNVYRKMKVSLAELEEKVYPCKEIGRYLCEQLYAYANTADGIRSPIRTGEMWFLGDSPAIGVLLCEHEGDYTWIEAPEISSDMAYIFTNKHRPIRVYHSIDSRFILEDLYAKLRLFAASSADGQGEFDRFEP